MYVDHTLTRTQLVEIANDLIPRAYMEEAAAIGSTSECVKKLQEFRDAGADEIAIYAGSPAQNADLLRAWRDR